MKKKKQPPKNPQKPRGERREEKLKFFGTAENSPLSKSLEIEYHAASFACLLAYLFVVLGRGVLLIVLGFFLTYTAV